MKTFGEILREKRKELKLSRRVLSLMSDVSSDAIRAYENCESFPNLINLVALADAFGCSIDELVGRNNEDAEKRLAELQAKIEQGKLIEFPRVVERKIPIYNERSIDFDKSTTVWDVEEMRPNGCVITRFLFESSAYQRLKELQNG